MNKNRAAGKRKISTERQLTFIAAARSSANDLHLFLNGQEIDLERDGDDWSGRDKRSVKETLAINFVVNGFDGTDWSMTVSIDCPENATKLLSRSGTVGDPGGHGFATKKDIPADPCAGTQRFKGIKRKS